MESNTAVAVSLQDLLNTRFNKGVEKQARPHLLGSQHGPFTGRRRGHGTDYDDLRPYSPGDDIRHIDWRASARTGALHTRLYREEKDHRILIATDLRASMYTGSQQLRAVVACRLAASLLWQATDGGSRASLLCFTDDDLSVSKPGAGSAAAINGCNLLVKKFHQAQQPAAPSDGTAQDSSTAVLSGRSADSTSPSTRPTSGYNNTPMELETVLRRVLQQSQQGGIIIWVSGMDTPGTQFTHLLNAPGSPDRHAFIDVYEPMLEHGLPPGKYRYRRSKGTLENSRSITLDRTTTNRLKTSLKELLLERKDNFARLRIPYLVHHDGDNHAIVTLRKLGYLP